MLLLGHRGDRQKYPDNSIEGISSALERGADGVEIDVYYHLKKGAYLVHPYLHDIDKDYPNLEDVFDQFGHKGILQIEIKFLEPEGIAFVKKIIKKHKVKDFILTSRIYPMLKLINDAFPKERINLLASRLLEDWWTEDFGNYFLFQYAKMAGANGIETGLPGFWTKKRVDFFHRSGFRVCGYLATATKAEYQQNLNLNLDSCIADNLDILKWRDTAGGVK